MENAYQKYDLMIKFNMERCNHIAHKFNLYKNIIILFKFFSILIYELHILHFRAYIWFFLYIKYMENAYNYTTWWYNLICNDEIICHIKIIWIKNNIRLYKSIYVLLGSVSLKWQINFFDKNIKIRRQLINRRQLKK